jgi:hypothetical protein
MRMTLATRAMVETLRVTIAANDTVIHLIKAPFTPTPNAVVADFDEADYTGYAAIVVDPVGTIAWDDEFLNGVQSFTNAHFQPTGSAVTNTIYGYYVTATVKDLDPDRLIDVIVLPTPVPLLGTMDALDLVYQFKIGPPFGQ